MRDGVKLATDIYFPQVTPSPVVAFRTPYGRATAASVASCEKFARYGYIVVAQDCRGTGQSEPEKWDYAVYEAEDSLDFVDWVIAQTWFDHFIASFGGSYSAMTQWCMAVHPAMSAIAPEVCGLRVMRSTVRPHALVNGYSKAVGRGPTRSEGSLEETERNLEGETLASGYFNDPLPTPLPDGFIESYPSLTELSLSEAKRQVWRHYCECGAEERTALLKKLLGVSDITYYDHWRLPALFDGLALPGTNSIPSVDNQDLCKKFKAPALVISGWYDWNLGDTLASWTAIQRHAVPQVSAGSRLIITPAAHHVPGYREGQADYPELRQNFRSHVALLARWYDTVRGAEDIERWPRVIFYLMGANEWRTSCQWPPRPATATHLYLVEQGGLSFDSPEAESAPDCYTYDPLDPTPTVGGNILSFIISPGSVDVGPVQARSDVLTYTTPPLLQDLDVVGPLKLVLYASSSAVDTDFAGRLSDVFPDGRAIQLQNGMLRARFRNPGNPELLEPGEIYRFEIDMWATANRFKCGHRIRLDVSSADFPRFDRNSNLGGVEGAPTAAQQTIYFGPNYPSHLVMSVVNSDQGACLDESE